MASKANFQRLRIYELSEELADRVWEIVAGWRRLPRDTVGRQLIRAADSIGANIAEGSGRGSIQDRRRFLYIARGSLAEVQHWLRRAHRRGLLEPEQIERLSPLTDELAPKLNAYLRSLNSRLDSERGRDSGQPAQRPGTRDS